MMRNSSGLLIGFLLLAVTLQEDVPVKFSCQGRAAGYYADVDSGCQIYHMCDGLGRQFSYSCPNTTLFQQRMLICDHWYMVNCSRSENDYAANLLIGQQKPFVEDSERDPYYRTPRPDLLSQPTASELNVIYRNGQTQNRTHLNLVGINSDYDQNNGTSRVTERPAYHLPSHWSTEYLQESGTPSTVNIARQVFESKETGVPQSLSVTAKITTQNTQSKESDVLQTAEVPDVLINKENVVSTFGNQQVSIQTNTPINRNLNENTEDFIEPTVKIPSALLVPIPKAINFNSNNLNNVVKSKNANPFPKKEAVVNFKSLFKATTPVFPTKEELVTTELPMDDILNPPDSNAQIKEFRPAPVQDIPINFKSLFKATTPVFPTREELVTTELPVDDILNPPDSDSQIEDVQPFLDDEVTINFKSAFKATTPVFPTKEELVTTESPLDDLLRAPDGDSQTVDVPKKEFVVHFKSSFKATTPVFPTKDELVTTELPLNDILRPPTRGNNGQTVSNVDIPLLNTNLQTPSEIFQPPKLPDDQETEDSSTEQNKSDHNKSNKGKSKILTRLSNEKVLKDLRKMFSIPDYEFPLDTVSRPGYDQRLDSFQVNPFLADVKQRQHAS